MVAPYPTPAIPLDGRVTSLTSLTEIFGNETLSIVAPNSAALGNSYQVTTAVMALYFAAFPSLNTTIIIAGATLLSPYAIADTVSRLLFNKTIGSASYAVAPLAADLLFQGPMLIKDLKGDANTNNITITFTGGELCDGQSTLIIDNNYGWVTINPIPDGGGYYQS